MFETLFTYPRVLRRHREGPLAEERAVYLSELAAQCVAPATLIKQARCCLRAEPRRHRRVRFTGENRWLASGIGRGFGMPRTFDQASRRVCSLAARCVHGRDDVIGGEHGDSTMAVLGVVPREERPAEGDGGVDIVDRPKPGWYFRVLNWASEKGLSSHLGAAQRASDPEVASSCRCICWSWAPRGRSAG